MITLNRAQSRLVDRIAVEEYGFSGLVLMENAGRGVADVLCQLLGPIGEREELDPAGVSAGLPSSASDFRPVVICCGKGNNAGDGFVIARHLELRGYPVRVLLWSTPEELTGDAATNFKILTKTDVPIDLFGNSHDAARLAILLEDAEWIVDGLLGTGARGEPRPPFDAVIDQLNAAAAPKLAIDLPSGLDCDTGMPSSHTVRAAHTCTFATAKPGFFVPEATPYVGQLHVLDIGVPRKILEQALAAQ